ncbi:MAG: hypothetical protein K940chlam9_01421 [Chlamydiae bacterium]|nr:hypothetical protein [Chlamydiota bacterium]
MPKERNLKKALLIVDVQNDFLPGGALAVPDGDQVIPIINDLQKEFPLVVATEDCHPENHSSFAHFHGKKPGEKIEVEGELQELWPVHCVQGSWGAELAPSLEKGRIDQVFYKGTDARVDSYSAFFDNQRLRSTGLTAYLREKGIEKLYIVGLATDYCVKFTALDALSEGFSVYVIPEGCRGIDLAPGDVEKAYFEMEKAGVCFCPLSC